MYFLFSSLLIVLTCSYIFAFRSCGYPALSCLYKSLMVLLPRHKIVITSFYILVGIHIRMVPLYQKYSRHPGNGSYLTRGSALAFLSAIIEPHLIFNLHFESFHIYMLSNPQFEIFYMFITTFLRSFSHFHSFIPPYLIFPHFLQGAERIRLMAQGQISGSRRGNSSFATPQAQPRRTLS